MAKTLYVDLDGTLCRSDTLFEASLQLLLHSPAKLLGLILALLKSRAQLKRFVSANVELSPKSLPFHEDFLAYLRRERAMGTRLVLATAADEKIAKSVSDHIGLFDSYISSDGQVNLKGSAKLERIKEDTPEFHYAGNAPVDLAIWNDAKGAVVVGPESLKEKAARLTNVDQWFPPEKTRLQVTLKALRVHQWAKNLLVFLPLLLSHSLNLKSYLLAFLGWLIFSLVASSVYLVNDLVDLKSDRGHPTKKKRPLAYGSMPLHHGVAWAGICFAAGLVFAFFLGHEALIAIGVYFIVTTIYSFKLKKIALVDTLTLAGLFTWRIISGGLITSTELSFWLMVFSVFFFLSLAFAKRAAELNTMKQIGRKKAAGRGYVVDDSFVISQLGISCGIASVVIFGLYLNSVATNELYSSPEYLILACGFILFWISRIWLLTTRGEMNEDPVAFAVKDKASYIIAVGVFISVVLATLINDT